MGLTVDITSLENLRSRTQSHPSDLFHQQHDLNLQLHVCNNEHLLTMLWAIVNPTHMTFMNCTYSSEL